jgi:tRNA A-37 threonylcarbamoyl transferase component Bud32
MQEMKDTRRALVRIGYDGRVHKTFRGHQAAERYANEIRVLRYLEVAGCPYVPRVLETHDAELRLITTNCGQRVERVNAERVRELFAELEHVYRVRHDDPFERNLTYSPQVGRFCLIDFEFATILDPAAPPGPVLDLPTPDAPRGD